jgi:hypothetical protein
MPEGFERHVRPFRGAVGAHQCAEVLEPEPGDPQTCLDGLLPEVSRKSVLPVPEGPQITTFSLRPIHSSVRSACCVGAGIEEAAGSQVSKVFPVGKPAALRLVAGMDRDRPVTSSVKRALMTSAGSQRWARAVAISSGASARAWGIFNCRISASSSAGSTGALAGTGLTRFPPARRRHWWMWVGG